MVQFNLQQLEAIAEQRSDYQGVKGSIVRLKVNDFMTYHKVELRAGPNVNLILGPNGTGKSTIVCAICIGLAGKPKILGRALSLKEYIRHDCKSASIEIELFNPDGENWVVKRYIKAQNNGATSTWSMNQKRVSQSQVESVLSKLNIQLDNLCQFLPQDRVQEFSKMDSFSLLRSTQLAMGKDTLIEKHDTLVTLNEEVKRIDINMKNSSDSLRAEQQYNQRLENEVKNFHERERFKKNIQDLKGKKLWLMYIKARTAFSQAKADLTVLETKKKEEEAKLAPLKRTLQQMQVKHDQFNKEMSTCRNVNALKTVKTKFEEECDKVEVKVNGIKSELDAIEKQEKDRQKHIDAAVQKLNDLVAELEKFNSEGYNSNDARLQQDIKTRNDELNKVSELCYKVQDEKTSFDQQVKGIGERIRLWNKEKEKLGDLRISRLKFMQREKGDAHTAVEVFAKPEVLARLKGKIHEPMILHASVDDLKYGKVVERHVGINDMTAFFCEHRDDLEMMLELVKPMNLRISIIHHEAPPANWQRPKPSIRIENLKPFGFHKFLIDLIQVPNYYLSYLVKKHRIQEIPIGKSPETDTKFDEITKKLSLQGFYTDENSYFMKKSLYGDGTCSSIDFLRPARIFTTSINADEREKLDEQIREAEKTKSEVSAKIEKKAVELRSLQEQRGKKEQELTEARRKVELKRQLTNKISLAKRGKEQLEQDIPDLPALRQKAQKDIWVEREKLTSHLDWGVNEIEKFARKGRQFIMLKRQSSVLQSRIMTKTNVLEDLQASINEHNGELQNLHEQVKVRASEAEKAKHEAVEHTKLREPPKDVQGGDLNISDLDREITQAESQMQFLVETDATIVKDYQERLKKIEKLAQERDDSMSKLSDLKTQIETKKQEWLGPLQSLIDRINSNFGTFFQNMGCAGEVSLCHTEDENDFAKYGIKIMVKFRNSEPLAEMCGTRVGTLQSGGERVITTALYVLALQELTVVPFRVIDEINQGMDAKNESRFFNLLCSLARGDNTPQYFLLTPKMLPPVDYPDNVDFHFIMNGPKVNVPYDGAVGSSEDEGGDDEDDDEGEDE